MISGIGTDIVEIERVKKVISDGFMAKVLSSDELERTKEMSETRKIQFLAGRFAAKEAIIKCLSDRELPNMSDLNITNDEKGKPEIRYKDYEILLSISHERNYATAVAVLCDKEVF
ncbi:MAG: holo-ACP synthase [Erysipelotrichaceae bacterium]|jgi:holo-[acyl-carrier protein] synthase|nr:holo-ACP synthase [Erysipelotrichaceae bacterium]